MRISNIRLTLEPFVLTVLTILSPLYAIYWVYNNFTLQWMSLLYATVLILSTVRSIFPHRAWCHRAWQPSKAVNLLGHFLFTIGLIGNSIAFSAIHRQHHRFSDTENDPHSPNYISRLRIQFMLPYSKVNIKYAVDHLKDPIHVWFSTYYWYINILWVTTLYFINPALVGFWVAVIGITTVKMNLVNNAGHSTTAVNVPWLAYIFLDGEFWHANHHDDPQNWNYSKEWYQFDFGAVVISTLCALGLATI